MKTTSVAFSRIVNGSHYGNTVTVHEYFIDSNKVTSNSAFFALKGNRSDGHKYIASALANGAALIVIDKNHKDLISNFEATFVVVEDTLKALQQFATWVRIKSKATIIGITGSCGKTTTKEMIASVLAQLGKTVKTPGNYNSEYGLPLSILQLEEDTAYGVFELGTDHYGMMENSSDIAGCEYAVITNIGISHLQNYNSREEIALEKSHIFLPYTKGFVSKDIDFLPFFEKNCQNLTIFENAIEDYQDCDFLGYKIKVEGKWGQIPLLGHHNLKNANQAIAVTRALGATVEDILNGFKTLEPIFGRSRIVEQDNITVLEDCYNATSDSMLSALDTLSNLNWSKGRKIAVLADMCELGFLSNEAHLEIGKGLLKSSCDAIYLFGSQMKTTYEFLKVSGDTRPVFYTNNFEVLFNALHLQINAGDLLLLKGSRIMSMEKLYPALRKSS